MQATSIYRPIQDGLARVEDNLTQMADRRFSFMGQLLNHVLESEGKRIRPALTLLASDFHPHDRKITEIMATAVELLHIATLVHDDTVDNSDIRRGKATVSSQWGRNVAILVGDYIFAASATLVCDTGDIRVIRRFSETIMELSTGELQELAEVYNCDQTMEGYLDRIHGKTASLFTTAGESGAILSGAPEDTVQSLKDYSHNLGMAFQIVDDILDFESTSEEVGKPVGNDLSRGIVTLPAMIAMRRYPDDNPISALFRSPHDREQMRRAVEMVLEPPNLAEAHAVAEEYGRKALDALRTSPQTPSRESLEELVAYILSRRR